MRFDPPMLVLEVKRSGRRPAVLALALLLLVLFSLLGIACGSAQTGLRQSWKADLPDVPLRLAKEGERLFVLSVSGGKGAPGAVSAGRVLAMDAGRGGKLWDRTLPVKRLSAEDLRRAELRSTAAGLAVYWPDTGSAAPQSAPSGRLRLLDPASGKVKWTSGRIQAFQVLFRKDLALLVLQQKDVVGIRIVDLGKRKTLREGKMSLPGELGKGVGLSGDRLILEHFFENQGHQVRALDLRSARELWREDVGKHVISEPGDDVIVTSDIQRHPGEGVTKVMKYDLKILDARTGKVLGQTAENLVGKDRTQLVPASLKGGRGRIVIVTEDPSGTALDLLSQGGKRLWRYAVGEKYAGHFVEAGEDLVFFETGSAVRLIDLGSGELMAEAKLSQPGAIPPPVSLVDGKSFYHGSGDLSAGRGALEVWLAD